jgi:hypothetical protein
MFGCRHFRGWEGESHLDVEAAVSPGVRRECRAVDAGDGEAQPVPAGMADPLGAEALERLEEAVHRMAGRSSVSDMSGGPSLAPVLELPLIVSGGQSIPAVQPRR